MHQYCFVLESTCPWYLQSDKYEYWLIDLYMSLLLHPRLKLIYYQNSKYFDKKISIRNRLVCIWQSSPSCKFARGKERKQLWGRSAQSLKIS